jgi:hypothetical protein
MVYFAFLEMKSLFLRSGSFALHFCSSYDVKVVEHGSFCFSYEMKSVGGRHFDGSYERDRIGAW